MSEIRLTVGIPSAGRVHLAFSNSLSALFSFIAGGGIKSRPESPISVRLDIVQSSNWLTNREKIVRNALDQGQTHLLFIDDDMSFDCRAVDSLFSRRQPCTVTNYLIKTEPASEAEFVAVSEDLKRRIPTTESSTGLQPIGYSGFGLSLFELDKTFAMIPQPWFMPRFVAEKSEYTTEDLPCFEMIRQHTPVYLDHDASKMVSHIGTKVWDWKEVKHG